MNRLVRSVITGGIIGAAVGVSMVMMKKVQTRESGHTGSRMLHSAQRSSEQAQTGIGGAAKMVRDNTMRWTSAMKNGTETLSKRLTRRLT